MDYVGFTNRHLFQRINEHTNSRSSIGKHMKLQHRVQRLASHADVLRLVTRSSSRGEERVTRLRTSAWEAIQRPTIAENFIVLKKCRSKLDCLVYEMLIIKELKPSLNVQSDSIRAKLFSDA